MITKELLGLSDLAKAQALCIHESTELIVVHKNKDLVFAAFQVMAPSLKSLNNGQEVMIVGLIAGLSGDHFSKKKAIRYL